ncbi:TetR/AcrR family transcriptional regulator [Paracoccus caeni]|uniref:TetR/AcrR family transcriptional regulator n=1 Tax=Paracoccus caeni TaxID=657651 RepID=A0A934SJ14_9RHOB|nr:TetR/AcrR family transcriptional regulator [Paracoccus caeni]MBK4216232.1 TetR/AcrR family transcriptional regulator [Paracoccus caeni]
MTEQEKSYHHGNLASALIAATVEIIDERGVDGLSVREVAKRAGVSPGAPFRHFSSKAALLTAVAEQAMERLVAAVEVAQADDDDTDPLAQIERIGLGYLEWATQNPTHFQIVSSRSLIDFNGSATLRQMNDGIRTRMADLLERAQQAGQLTANADTEALVLSCRAFVYGLARMAADGHFPEWHPNGEPLDLMRRALADFIAGMRA